MNRLPIFSNSIEEKPQFAVVTTEGIVSVHVIEYDAKHNAKMLNGMVAPIDWVGEEMILPIVRL